MLRQLKAQQQERESSRPTRHTPRSDMLARQPCAWHGHATPCDQVGPFKQNGQQLTRCFPVSCRSKGAGLEPSCRAVCLCLPGLRSSSGTGQGKGAGAKQVAPTDPSSGRLWVLSLLRCLWHHLVQKGI